MLKNTFHILLAGILSLTPPGAAMVEYTCDETGATTQIISTLGSGNHVDECCDDEATRSHSFTSVADDCCRATVFTLPQTSPAPTQLEAGDAPALVPLDVVRPEATAREAVFVAQRFAPPSISRNLPLLV